MMNRYVFIGDPSSYSLKFSVEACSLSLWHPPVIVSANILAPIITQENPYKVTFSSFGMTPFWARHPVELLTARSEGDKNLEDDPEFSGSKAIFMKKAFRKPLFPQRCIVIADALIVSSSKSKDRSWLVDEL